MLEIKKKIRAMKFYDFKSGFFSKQCKRLRGVFGDEAPGLRTKVYIWLNEFTLNLVSLSDEFAEGKRRKKTLPLFQRCLRNIVG